MRPTLTWTLLALLLCGTAIGAVLLLYPSEPAPVAPFASPPQATPAAKPSIEEQLREYAQESDKVIAEVLASVDGEEQRHAAIDERLKALRKQIFGEENPRLLQR